MMPTNTPTVIACDPGITGAFAIFEHGKLVQIVDMPTISRVVSGKERRMVCPDALDVMLRGFKDREYLLFVLEQVGARPKEGAVGAFAFGKGVGHVEGIAIGMRLPRITVEPSVWKRKLKLKRGKDASRQRAMETFPHFRESFIRVKDDGRAEAALIGLWAIEFNGGLL